MNIQINTCFLSPSEDDLVYFLTSTFDILPHSDDL